MTATTAANPESSKEVRQIQVATAGLPVAITGTMVEVPECVRKARPMILPRIYQRPRAN